MKPFTVQRFIISSEMQAGSGFERNIQLFLNPENKLIFFCTLNSQPVKQSGKQ